MRAEKGTAMTIHSRKGTDCPTCVSSNPAMATLGGVPTRVAIPPRFAAYAVPSSNATGNRGFRSTSILSNTDMAMGSIIKVVAVFEIHMLNPAVANMNPASNRRGCPPASTKMFKANRRCSCHRSKARAMRKPPMNKNTYLEP